MDNKIYKLYIEGTILNDTNINFKFYGSTGITAKNFNKPDETIKSNTEIFKVDTSSQRSDVYRKAELHLHPQQSGGRDEITPLFAYQAETGQRIGQPSMYIAERLFCINRRIYQLYLIFQRDK